MAVLRVSRPGQATEFVDLGASVGRTHHTRGAVPGGTLIVPFDPKAAAKVDKEAKRAKERETDRIRYEKNRERILEQQRRYYRKMRGIGQ